jgi:1,4-dihydroxy-6-naphthoate synthase
MPPVRLAFSPDSDDLFMFWPLLHGKIDTRGLSFVYDRADTETLNERAARAEVDVIAVSIARYAELTDDYLLLPHGASVGRGYGPVVIGRAPESLADLDRHRIGVPGLHTTAYLALRLLLPRFEPKVIPISPFTLCFDAVRSGDVDAALLIHEGRLTYERQGFFKVVDLGEAWSRMTGGLPLPLGGNVIRRGLGEAQIALVSRLCRESIAWALGHREEVITEILGNDPRPDVGLDRSLLDRYLTMYANQDTLELAPDAREAVAELFRRAVKAGLLARTPKVEFAR